MLAEELFNSVRANEIHKMRLQHILTDSQFELAKELKQKLINLKYSEARNIIDYLNDEILFKENREKSRKKDSELRDWLHSK